jgi:dCMP deaminase
MLCQEGDMNLPEYLLTVAKAVASRSKCRRQVGCVFADKDGMILSTGYNGWARGLKNCTFDTCTNKPGVDGECLTIHAELNCALFCKSPEDIYYVAVTRLPCHNCAALLLNTPGKVLIYQDECSYPKSLELLGQKYELIKL